MNQLCEKLTPVAFLIARVLVAYMFLLHGTAKLFEFPMSMTGGNGAVPLFSLFGIAAILEVVGGILIILGLFTRPVAVLLSGQMAYAYFIFHAANEGNTLLPILNKGELAAVYSLFFLLLAFVGAGKYSLDHKLFANK